MLKKFISFFLSTTLLSSSISFINTNTVKAEVISSSFNNVEIFNSTDETVKISYDNYEATINQITNDEYIDLYEYDVTENGVNYILRFDSKNDRIYINDKSFTKETFEKIMENQIIQLSKPISASARLQKSLDLLSISQEYDYDVVNIDDILYHNKLHKEEISQHSHYENGNQLHDLRCTFNCTGSINVPTSGYSNTYSGGGVNTRSWLVAPTGAALLAIASGLFFGIIKAAEQIYHIMVTTYGQAVIGQNKTVYYRKWIAKHTKCPIAFRDRLNASSTSKFVNNTDYFYNNYYGSKPY